MYQNQEQKFGGLAVAMQAIMREPRFLNNDDVWEIVTVTSEHMAELREQFKDALEDSLSTGVSRDVGGLLMRVGACRSDC